MPSKGYHHDERSPLVCSNLSLLDLPGSTVDGGAAGFRQPCSIGVLRCMLSEISRMSWTQPLTLHL